MLKELMKYSILISLATLLLTGACDIDSKIDRAADKCEERVTAILEEFEDVCLTKEEILDLLREMQGQTDTYSPRETHSH
jgi:hypothetical protein